MLAPALSLQQQQQYMRMRQPPLQWAHSYAVSCLLALPPFRSTFINKSELCELASTTAAFLPNCLRLTSRVTPLLLQSTRRFTSMNKSELGELPSMKPIHLHCLLLTCVL
jgi:hypothetical protein